MFKKYIKVIVLLLLSFFLMVRCDSKKEDNPPEKTKIKLKANNKFYENLAYYHAPIHYQDVNTSTINGNHGLNGYADFITSVNYDKDWTSINNWDNLAKAKLSDLKAYVYYSVVEAQSFYYIIYAFYHPRDWAAASIDEHENDLEGFLLIVSKNSSDYGQAEAMITVSHKDFYSYKREGSIFTKNKESIDGKITFDESGHHPKTAQQSMGHGLKAWPFYDIKGGDGVVYKPLDNPDDMPGYPQNTNDRDVKYKLVSFFDSNGLWDRRHDKNMFAENGSFYGDNAKDNAANPPWLWDDHNDGSTYAGEIATDPAKLADYYFNGTIFPSNYINNYYQNIIDGKKIDDNNNTDPIVIDKNPFINRIDTTFRKIKLEADFDKFYKSNKYPYPKSGHMQGIQKKRTGNFLISGSSKEKAYILEVDGNYFQIKKLYDITESYEGKKLKHAGGFQIIGDYFVVGVENKKSDGSKVVLYDTNGKRIKYLVTRPGKKDGSGTAGAVGITKLNDGYFLMVVGSWNSDTIDVYKSREKNKPLKDSTFVLVNSWKAKEADKSNWRGQNNKSDKNWGNYQSLNLAQDGTTGEIFLFAFNRSAGRDFLDFYAVNLNTDVKNYFTKRQVKHMKCKKGASFRWSAGIYVKNANNIYVFSTERDFHDKTTINVFRTYYE